MDEYLDKQQEIKQIKCYIEKIVSSSDVKWKVTTNTFSVTIRDKIDRTFTKAELESYEQQVKYFLHSKIEDEDEYLKTYLNMLENVRNKYKMCSKECFSVHNPVFYDSQYSIKSIIKKNKGKKNKKDDNEIKLILYPKVQDEFSISDNIYNFTPKDYYSFGKYILNEGDKSVISEELYVVFNKIGFIKIDFEIVKEFLRSDDFLESSSINPIKVGKKFVDFLVQKKDTISADISSFDLTKKVENNKSLNNLQQFVSRFLSENLLFAKVPKPSHTLHLIQPSYAIWIQKNKGSVENFCPLENILFCEEDHNFKESLNNISNKNDDKLYFIVHPENLRSDEMQFLKTFISSRRIKNLEPKDSSYSKNKQLPTIIPKIMIITALPISFFSLEENSNIKFDDYNYFMENDIAEFATFNAEWRRSVCKIRSDIFLFSSNYAGQGKTYQIKNIIRKSLKKFTPEMNDVDIDDYIRKSHFYFDITTNEIPELIKGKTYVHFSISPEIFLNNFHMIDQLYILIQYGSFIFESGLKISYYDSTDIIPTFLIEMPNLNQKNSLKNYYDFPVALSNNQKLWEKEIGSNNYDIYNIIKDEFNGIGKEEYFINGHFHLNIDSNQITIDNENVRKLVNMIFKNVTINNYKDLINESKSLFFGNLEFDDKSYIDDNRIISKFKEMINDYSNQIVAKYHDDEKMRKIFFLLAIRTALYVWHFTPSKSRSIILLIPKRLMPIKPFNINNGWIFVGFYSKRDNGLKWIKENIQEVAFNDDKSFIEEAKNEFKKENEYIHILTDTESNDNDIFLQVNFLKTILLLVPNIDYKESSKNPLNIGIILLMLFSNLNHFPRDHFHKIIDDLGNNEISIDDCKTKYGNNEYEQIIEWTEMDELLAYYLRNNNDSRNRISSIKDLILQLKSELGEHKSIWNIIKISFSKTYFGRFIEIILKIYYRYFSILQGDTGCGKTSVVRLLDDIITLVKSDNKTKSDSLWKFSMIDFHGSFTQEDFDKELEKLNERYNISTKETDENKENEKIIVFLDEVNTSPAYYYVIDHIQNSTSEYLSYIAAINAYEKVDPITRDLSRVGIQQKINRQLSNIKLFTTPPDDIKKLTDDFDANKYAYNVKKHQESVKSAVILTDPQEFDEENPHYIAHLPDKKKYIVCFSDEEKIAIRSIVTKIILQWENNTKIELNDTIDILSNLISEIFITVRSFMKIRAIFSYRDVFRCATIFTNIFDYFNKKNLERKLPKRTKEMKDELWNKITSISVVISIYISLISRFSHEEIKTNESMLERFKNHPFQEIVGSDPSYICVYKIVLNYISDKKKWPSEKLPYIGNWEQISILFAYAKCTKYIINEKTIYPLPSLMLHLLILSLTVSASFHDKSSSQLSSNNSDFFTCLIIGMPGTSKSKAVEIYKKYHLEKDSEKTQYFITTYLCSRTSDSDSLLAQFMNGAWFLKNSYRNENRKAIVILEEVGLANYNPSRPLKILHHLCDKGVKINANNQIEYCKVIPIQLSNYAIDFANMNRGFLVCAGLPTDSEFSSSIALGKILKNNILRKELKRSVFPANLLFKIVQSSDESLLNYEDTINSILSIIIKDQNEQYHKEFDKKKEFYENSLRNLWEITQISKTRPPFFQMRPLFNLIDRLTKLKEYEDKNGEYDDDEEKEEEEEEKCQNDDGEDDTIYMKLTFLLNSFIHDKDKVKEIFNQEKLDDAKNSLLNKYLKSLGFENCIQKKQINSITLYHSFKDSLLGRKALLIRTENYEAYRFFDLLSRKEDPDTYDSYIINFVPFQYQDVAKDCQRKFDKLFEILCEDNDDNDDKMFLFIGNDPFSDYIIDILNSINHKNQCPTAILKGFPVYLPNFPDNIKFIFIINESDIYNPDLKNPVPYPLIDRLDHLFLNKKIMRACSKNLLKKISFDKEKAKYLLEINKNDEGKYLYNYLNSDFLYLKDAILQKNVKSGKNILDNHFKNSFIRSLNDLILKLNDILSNSEELFSSVIVFTRTPIYEQFDNEIDKEFVSIDNIRADPISEIRNAKAGKNLIVHSDIFNLPDENTLNNALLIVQSVSYKIYDNLKFNKKFCYIIVFHINENRIPDSFGFTSYFPVVWIESLPETAQEIVLENIKTKKGSKQESKEIEQLGTPLIQDICNAIYNEELPDSSPLFKRIYAKVVSDFGVQLVDKDKQKKINALKSSSGIKIANGKYYKIQNIIDIISKQPKEGESVKNYVSFKEIKKEIINKVNEIHDNLINETNEQIKIQKDHILNEQLDNLDIEVRFFSAVSSLIDEKVSIMLSIVIKYIASIEANSTKIENVNNFVQVTYDCVNKFSKILPEINLYTFSSLRTKKEISKYHPELLFYNVLKPFLSEHCIYNSLNKMKKLMNLLPPLNGMKLVEIRNYINSNYFDFQPNIPFNDIPDATKITIEIFDDFFNSRGLISKNNKKISDICQFMEILPDSPGIRNLAVKTITILNIKNLMQSNQWGKIQYKEMLLFDCNSNFIDTCSANDYPHPCIIYNHFINIVGFGFKDYNDGNPDGKIFMNSLIPWITNFFLFGSFNKCKQEGYDSLYLNNLVYFINLAITVDKISESMFPPNLLEFLYDLLFSEFCKKNPKEKIDSFSYIDHFPDIPILNNLFETHTDFYNSVKAISLTNDVNNTEIELTKDDFNPFSDEFKEVIKAKFMEIGEIEKEIQIYDSWKEKHLIELSNNNIFENICSFLFEESVHIDDEFGSWFLNSEIPLLARQVYEVCRAIKNDKNDRMEAEFKILCRLINPWNNDDRVAKFFWNWFIDSLHKKSPFEKVNKLILLMNDSCLKPIFLNCSPYYVCDCDENVDDDEPVKKGMVISKKNEIKTFYIERLLYTNTICLLPFNKAEKDNLSQIFNFMSSLPFVKQTKNLYILAGFINEIMRVFRDQINLLFLILNPLQNCIDLLNISQFKDLIDDPNRTESREALEEALKAADEYNKGTNAVDKIRSYINRLIEINNNTILHPDANAPKAINYRLVTKANIHPNMSLMNTFLPALAHLDLKEGVELYNIIPYAFKVLTGNKKANDQINNLKLYASLPSIFDFSSKSYPFEALVKISKIDDKNDLFGFPIDDLPNSLCSELGSFLRNDDNKLSHRVKIWELIKNAHENVERPDYSFILDTLIPLFEECDDDDVKEVDFESLKGVEAAAHFLKSYKVGDKSLFEKIVNNL